MLEYLALLLKLFLVFSKVGLLAWGGGPSMIPLMQQEVLAQNWLTPEGFIDALALGNALPGPIATKMKAVGRWSSGTSDSRSAMAFVRVRMAATTRAAPSPVPVMRPTSSMLVRISSSVSGAMVKTGRPARRRAARNSGGLPRCPIAKSGRAASTFSALGVKKPPTWGSFFASAG